MFMLFPFVFHSKPEFVFQSFSDLWCFMAAYGAISVNVGYLPVSCRKFSSPARNVRTPRISPRRSALSTEQTPTNLPKEVRFEKQSGTDKIEKPRDDPEIKRLSLKDYIEQSRELIRSDGGPPRWFSPLECRSRLKNSPLLLFLPGIDGTGLGLILHHQRLGKIFDIWCLHIPVMDRTPFEDLVQLVERTIRSEYFRAPNRPIYLVGESLGGCLALSIAARNPDIDLVLLLANPATSFSKSHIQPLVSLLEVVPDQFPLTFPPILDLIAGNPLEKAIAGIGKGLPPQQTIGELVQDLFAWIPYLSVLADILPRESLWWKLRMLKSASSFTNSRLHAVKSQTLILSSGRDQFLPSKEEAERLQHALQTCQVRHFEDKSHSLLMEDDIDLVTIIKGACFYRRSKYHDCIADYMPPTYSEFEQAVKSYRWLDITVNPVMFSTLEDGKIVKGLAGIPFEGPVVLVGYHMLLGWDVGPLVSSFFSERNILLRGIAHPMMFERESEGLLPDISAFDSFRIMGAVPVSATNFYKLLSAGSHILLYPGGIREALHRKGEEYKLFWPEQSEFVRMAARFGAKIIPFGSVGEDDLCEVFFDYDDLRKIPYFKAQIEELSKSAVRLRSAVDGEVANQDLHLPGMIPKFPGRFYFLFGKPIETEGRKQELRDRQRAHELYLHAKSEVERCISYLKKKREKDPYRNLLPRLFYQATQGYSSEVPTFEL